MDSASVSPSFDATWSGTFVVTAPDVATTFVRPALRAVTLPVWSIDAIVVSSTCHVTAPTTATFAESTRFAVSCCFFPSTMRGRAGATTMRAIGPEGRAATTSLAFAGFPATMASMLASPGATAVTWPVTESTVAISGLLERQPATVAGIVWRVESTIVPATVNVSPTVAVAGTPDRLTVPGAGPTTVSRGTTSIVPPSDPPRFASIAAAATPTITSGRPTNSSLDAFFLRGGVKGASSTTATASSPVTGRSGSPTEANSGGEPPSSAPGVAKIAEVERASFGSSSASSPSVGTQPVVDGATVKLTDASTPPALAVIVTSPGVRGLTRPPAATVATSESLLCQVTSDASIIAPASLTTHASSANGTPASITGGGGEMNTDCTAPCPTEIVVAAVLPSQVQMSCAA